MKERLKLFRSLFANLGRNDDDTAPSSTQQHQPSVLSPWSLRRRSQENFPLGSWWTALLQGHADDFLVDLVFPLPCYPTPLLLWHRQQHFLDVDNPTQDFDRHFFQTRLSTLAPTPIVYSIAPQPKPALRKKSLYNSFSRFSHRHFAFQVRGALVFELFLFRDPSLGLRLNLARSISPACCFSLSRSSVPFLLLYSF